MHVSITTSGTVPKIERCTTCCDQFHCPMCLRFKPTRLSKLQTHFESHKKSGILFKDKIICRCGLTCRDSGHYHCPLCSKTVLRRPDMTRHLETCRGPMTAASPEQASPPTHHAAAAVSSSVLSLQHVSSSTSASAEQQSSTATPLSTLPQATVSTSQDWAASEEDKAAVSFLVLPAATEAGGPRLSRKKKQCPHCSYTFYKKNMVKHIQRKHSRKSKDIPIKDCFRSVCVDATNGIFAVQKKRRYISVPIYVQKKTWGRVHNIECELQECRQCHLMAVRSGLASPHCDHVRSLDYCSETATEEVLKEEVLSEMVALKVFGEAQKKTCLNRQRYAKATHVPLCVQVSLQESQNHFFFSIHEPSINHYCRLGRVMVSYSRAANTWRCPCAKPSMSCAHKNLSKWHLFQTNRDVFRAEAARTAPEKHQNTGYPPPDDTLGRLVKYLHSNKKIPAELPDDLMKPKALSDHLTELHPTETVCTNCPGPVHLQNSSRITEKAEIITMNGILENVSTYYRCCPQCQMVYRYQEWKDGLHNFDDHTILTLELCLYVRRNLQNNISVSEVINSLESLRKVKFPARDTLLHAYCHFEALTRHNYSYYCLCCGFFPPVVQMDLHKKGVFNLPVSDKREPSENFTGVVDIKTFWDSVQLEMIARGFFPSRAKNIFAVNPSFEHWRPWIGKDAELNAESSTEAKVGVSEDRLFDELSKQKISTVRKWCRALNLESEGSRMDLVVRLAVEMNTRHSYDHFFPKIWGACGGWSVILCPHGVVYSLKFNLRAQYWCKIMNVLNRPIVF
ncbi:uncharacterized protein PAE49_021033 [Odontesthes bonariensis]|uniref:uncharacterized protein LOC142368577 n=1 Tax=Odontesthes bonariensis TaxID=219752 RepID=UPI003F582240